MIHELAFPFKFQFKHFPNQHYFTTSSWEMRPWMNQLSKKLVVWHCGNYREKEGQWLCCDVSKIATRTSSWAAPTAPQLSPLFHNPTNPYSAPRLSGSPCNIPSKPRPFLNPLFPSLSLSQATSIYFLIKGGVKEIERHTHTHTQSHRETEEEKKKKKHFIVPQSQSQSQETIDLTAT